MAIVWDMGEKDEKRTIDQTEVGLRDSDLGKQADLATYVAAAQFGPVALPSWMPDWQKQMIERDAAMVQRLPGAVMFDDSSPTTRREEGERRRDRETSDMANVYQQVQQQQQEREEWARTPSTVGGVTMNGIEWTAFADRLKSDDDLRDRILAAYMARGMGEQEAEARLERVRQVAEIAAIPPSQRTDEQKETMEMAEADKSFKKDMATAQAETNNATTQHKTELSQSFDRAVAGVDKSESPASVTLQAASRPTLEVGQGP